MQEYGACRPKKSAFFKTVLKDFPMRVTYGTPGKCYYLNIPIHCQRFQSVQSSFSSVFPKTPTPNFCADTRRIFCKISLLKYKCGASLWAHFPIGRGSSRNTINCLAT